MVANPITDNDVNRQNSKIIFSPKFIPYYPWLQKLGLDNVAILVYGFIDFYAHSSEGGFYYTNQQLAGLLNVSETKISQTIGNLEKSGLIKTIYQVGTGGGKVRFIESLDTDISLFPTYRICKSDLQNLQVNNNILNIYRAPKKFFSSKQEIKEIMGEDVIGSEMVYYIIWRMIELGYKIPATKQDMKEVEQRVRKMSADYIPRNEQGTLNRNLAKSYVDGWYDYWSETKKPIQKFKSSLRNAFIMYSKDYARKKAG